MENHQNIQPAYNISVEELIHSASPIREFSIISYKPVEITFLDF